MKKILIWLGLRSKCCGAKKNRPKGWARVECSKCYKRL